MLILPIGIPGCGKSTLGRQLEFKETIHKHSVVSRDQYREILTGDIRNQEINDTCYEITDKIAISRLRYHQDVYLDATNLLYNWYKPVFQYALKKNHPIIYIYFDNVDEAVERNKARGEYAVPDRIMNRMIERWNNVNLTGTNHVKYDKPDLAWYLRTERTSQEARWNA
jgi:tRNA uridine 5-carbamoylmethylation protein Kti12